MPMYSKSDRIHVDLPISLLVILVTLSGCMVEREPRPDYWPPLVLENTFTVWDEHIPHESVKQLSDIFNSPDLIDYRSRGYTPRLIVNIDYPAGLYLVNDSLRDTVMVWNTVQKKNFPWDKKLRKITVQADDFCIKLFPKYIYESKGGDPLLGFTRESVFIYRDTLGALQIQKRWWAAGLMFMLIPTYMQEHTWYRYETGGANLKSVVLSPDEFE